MKTFFSIPALFTALTVLSLFSCKKEKVDAQETVIDIDGNVYHAVTIGTQVWMVENLKTTRYRNGDSISNVKDSLEWAIDTLGAYCNYNNDSINASTYGRLYNWYTVKDNRNIAPAGWHVPSDEEWVVLINYLGGEGAALYELKETGTNHWLLNGYSTNRSGFTALPGGSRSPQNGSFGNEIGYYGSWWSSTEYSASNAWNWFMGYDASDAGENFSHGDKRMGLSVRCVRD